MTTQSFEKFVAELGSNTALREQVQALAREQGAIPLSAVSRLAAGKGYRFSVEDVSSELDDEQLEAVAGGVGTSGNKLTWNKLTGHKIGGGVSLGTFGGSELFIKLT